MLRVYKSYQNFSQLSMQFVFITVTRVNTVNFTTTAITLVSLFPVTVVCKYVYSYVAKKAYHPTSNDIFKSSCLIPPQ